MTKAISKQIADTARFKAVSEEVLKQAKISGASGAEVMIAANKGFSVSARNSDVETVEYHQDKSIEIKVYFGKRAGSASLSDIQPQAIKAAVDAACHIAKFTDEDPASGLAKKEELAFDYPPLEMTYPWHLTVEEAIQLACECEREALGYDKRIMSAEEVGITTGEGWYLYANSEGFTGDFSHTRHEMSCVLVAKDKSGMQRDYSYTASVNPKHLESTSEVAKKAAERTIKRLGARRLPTMKTPVIYIADQARGLFSSLVSAISGGNIYRKSSFLVDHLGKQIFPDNITIKENPFLKEGMGTAPFDGDGVATRENVFVDAGVLNSYALGVYSARKLGMKTTGNAGGIHNLLISHSEKDLAVLLKEMGKGLLITEMMGGGVNLITGDYSRGVGGFWVENGEIQYPVHEITVAGKMQNMFMGIQVIGKDVDIRGNVRSGSVLIDEMTVAGE